MSTYKSEGFAEERYYQFPNIINLEVFRGQCPCSCEHCPVGRMKPERREHYFGVKHIDGFILQKVINEMQLYPHSTIRLHSVGDPIVWKGLRDVTTYIHGAGINSWLFTSLLTNEIDLIEHLANYCSIIEVSVNSIDSHDYFITKGVNAFDIILSNIKYLSNYIKVNQLKTRLIVSRVQSSSLKRDMSFITFWKNSGLVDDAFVRKYHNYNNILGGGDEFSTKPPCLVHWMRFNISCEGKVVSCFNELFRKTIREDVILGDLRNESIYNIWHGDNMKALRIAELQGYANSLYKNDFPCRECRFCQPYDTSQVTSEYQISQIG